MKLSTFTITRKQGLVLNISLVLSILFSVLFMVECWGEVQFGSQGLMRSGYDYGSSEPVALMAYLGLTLANLTMLEVFRRCLKKENHFTAHFSVVMIMVSICFIALSYFLSSYFAILEWLVTSFLFTSGMENNNLANTFRVVLFFFNIFLCVQLMRKYAGRLYLYGASLIACPVLYALLYLLLLFVSFMGIGLTDVFDIPSIFSVISCVLAIIPFCVLRTTMDVKEEN